MHFHAFSSCMFITSCICLQMSPSIPGCSTVLFLFLEEFAIANRDIPDIPDIPDLQAPVVSAAAFLPQEGDAAWAPHRRWASWHHPYDGQCQHVSLGSPVEPWNSCLHDDLHPLMYCGSMTRKTFGHVGFKFCFVQQLHLLPERAYELS